LRHEKTGLRKQARFRLLPARRRERAVNASSRLTLGELEAAQVTVFTKLF
jgi:hypothetical protein